MSVAIDEFTIYQAVDPRDGLPFYVGFTANIQERIQQHLGGDISNGAKYERIAELKQLGLIPRFEVLERISGTIADARQRESYWIRYQMSAGAPLLNTGVPLEETMKYTTHLRPETIKAIRVYAALHDMKDYEVAQLAFDLLLKESEQGND